MRVRVAGERALLVSVDGLETVHRLTAALRAAARPGVVDIVPGYSTVLVTGDGGLDLVRLARELPLWELPPAEAVGGRLVEIPVVYDGEDLEEVCRLSGLPADDVVSRHTAPEYVVAFLGFSPGFPYLSGLAKALQVPRRMTPRASVPAGSVGLAGDQTGVYPSASPGGWQLIGRTDLVLWDVSREPPALLAPGDRVRFRAVA
ncbi:MAG: 5-oxoprolinase subunit PxpB [Mycobacteriales bacterium]